MKKTKASLGFTVIELAVVIGIIGILAIITSVGAGNWRKSIAERSVKSDLNQVVASMNNYKNFHDGYPLLAPGSTFTSSTGDAANHAVFESSDDVTLTYSSGDLATFCINGTSVSNPSVLYYISESGSVQAGSCAAPQPPVFAVKSLEATVGGGCEVSTTNLVYCWGSNYFGQFGNGNTTSTTSPVQVTLSGALTGKTIKKFAIGSVNCAIASDDLVYCMGSGQYGSLGNGTNTNSSVPVAVTTSGVLSGKTVRSITIGSQSVCVIASDNLAYCWGQGAQGQLGNGSNSTSNVPVAVTTSGVLAGKTLKQISMSSGHTCAIASDNLAYCWGLNVNGQLGDGTTTSTTTPVAVTTSGVLAGKTIRSISAGASSTCAIASDNLAYCWGLNNSGQLGNGTNTNSSVPVAVTTSGVLSGKTVKAISRGGATCAIASDDQVYCWGPGSQGSLGSGGSSDSNVPVAVFTSGVLLGKTIKALSSGANCVIASDDKAYCWGYGGSGTLGNGSTSDSLTPVAVLNP